MALISIGFGEDGAEQYQPLRLSRREAAAYVGITESGIRDAERRGLHHVLDRNGQSWLDPADLEEWTWRATGPSQAKRSALLGAAAKARAHEARLAAEQDEKRRAEQDREDRARYVEQQQEWEAEDKLRAEVRSKNDAAREEFLRQNLDERAAFLALGFSPSEGRSRLRALSRSGVLQEKNPPREMRLTGGFGTPMRVEPSGAFAVSGGPFYSREAIIRARAEARALAVDACQHGPSGTAQPVRVEAVATDLLRAFLDRK